MKLIEVPPHVAGAVFCFEHLTIRAAVAPRLVEQVPMVICQTGEVLPHVRLLGHLACFVFGCASEEIKRTEQVTKRKEMKGQALLNMRSSGSTLTDKHYFSLQDLLSRKLILASWQY